MPTFLLPDLWDGCLDPDHLDDPHEMIARLAESSDAVAQTLTSYRVRRQVNNTQKANPHRPGPHRPID